MGVGVYLAAPARSGTPASVAGFEDLDDFDDLDDLDDVLAFACFLAALLRAAGFLATARFFMARTLPPARASVNAPAGAAVRPSAA